jgi:hypothetical protein
MGRSVKEPRFSKKSRLVRYVDEVNRLSGNRPSPAAFIDEPSVDPDDHLSVNSLELETLKQIAAYHRWRAQSDLGKVALCEHQVREYSEAGAKSGVPITYDLESSQWQFSSRSGKLEPAYRYRPVRPYGGNADGSPSHCGVEFKRAFNEHKAAQFARRLSGKKFHMV